MEIHIQTLGRFAVFQNGQELPRFSEQPTRAALLVYLAVERDVTRDTAEAVIWSDLPPDRARHSLNQTLYRLRKDLGEEWLLAEGDRLRVTDAVRVDAIEFAGYAEMGDSVKALGTYGGGFLAGWHLLDTPTFEHWTNRQHGRLSRLHREACRTRISELRSEGRLEEGLELAQTWVMTDPLEDEAHHNLIELLGLSGKRSEAIERYDAYEKLLSQDDLEPLEETQALIKFIRLGREPLDFHPAEGGTGPSVASEMTKEGHPFIPPVSPASARGKGLRPGSLLVPVATVVLLGILLFSIFGRTPAGIPAVPNRVLVFPLENQTGDPSMDPVGRLAADWITQGLATAEFLQVVPIGELLGSFGGQGEEGGLPGNLDLDLLAAQETRAGTLVKGTYYKSGPGLEFHVQLLEAPDWRVLETIGPVRSSSLDPMEAVDVLRQRVMVNLAVHRDEALGGLFTESDVPPTYPAYLAYIEGARKISIGNWRGATADLLKAHELSPGFTAPLIFAGFGLIQGWGDYGAADSVTRIVDASKESLPTYDRLRLEFLEATLEGDIPRGYLAMKQAAAIIPGGTAHYALGQEALSLNRPREALDVLSTWDPTRSAVIQWTPYWRTVTGAYHLMGDHEGELDQANRGRAQIPDRVEMLWYQVRALAALGRITELNQLLEESLSLRWSTTLNPGSVMIGCASELWTHGHQEEVARILLRFRTWYDALDDETQNRESIRVLNARALYLEGRLDSARQVVTDLLEENPDDPWLIRNLGAIAARVGDRATAMEYEETLARMDRPYLFGSHTRGRAVIAALLGDSARAVALLQTSVAEGVRFGPDLLSDPDLVFLHDFPAYREFIEPRG